MEKKKNKSFGYNSFQKVFLLSKCLEEPKVQKGWFSSQIERYMSAIKKNVDSITKDGKYDPKKKNVAHSLSHNKHNFHPDINNFTFVHHISKGNKYNLKKYTNIRLLSNISNNIDELVKNDSSINLDSPIGYKNKTININKSVDRNINQDSICKNKYSLNLDLNTLPNIPQVNKNKYITKYINKLSEKTDLLEKKLMKQENMKYIGFKSKYNRLYNEYKKFQVDIDQYVNPKKDKRYKFNLNASSGGINEQKMANLRKVMRQISNKIKNIHQNKPSIEDIINEVENFKFREKRLRDRIKKSHDKFDYLIHDSNVIQKRIDIKCQKIED